MNKIEYLVVHCADTPDDKAFFAKDIHQWHLERGWSGIGYHRVIDRDGKIENGRPDYWQGAHVKGYNHCSLGVCLIGRKEFTRGQFSSLRALLNDWSNLYPDAKIVGHTELNPGKTCPNFDVQKWLKRSMPEQRG